MAALFRVNDEVVLIVSHTYRVQRASERLFSNPMAIKPHGTSGMTSEMRREIERRVNCEVAGRLPGEDALW